MNEIIMADRRCESVHTIIINLYGDVIIWFNKVVVVVVVVRTFQERLC